MNHIRPNKLKTSIPTNLVVLSYYSYSSLDLSDRMHSIKQTTSNIDAGQFLIQPHDKHTVLFTSGSPPTLKFGLEKIIKQ